MSLANVLWLVGLATLPSSARALDEAPMQLDDPLLEEPAPLRARLIPPRLLPQDGASGDSFHDAIEEMHDSIRRMFGEDGPFDRGGRFGLQGGAGSRLELGPGSSFSRTFENNGERESTSIRVGPDGRVKVEQEKNGEKTTIEAESLEALRKEHPELLPEFLDGRGGLGRMSLRIGPFGAPPQPPLLPQPRAPRARNRLEKPAAPQHDPLAEQDAAAPAPREDATPASRPRLGVQVAPVKADVADYLELEPGVGLEIVRVVPDSAAETIGIQARDILTEVNGRTIRSADDVAKALAGKDPATAEVIVIRRGAEKPFDPSKRPRKQ